MTRAVTMSPFRLFARPARPAPAEPDPWLDDPAPGPHPGQPDAYGPAPGDGRATAAARPSLWTAHRPPQTPPPEPEPVTDPFGFAPIPPPRPAADGVRAGRAAWAPDGGARVTGELPPPGLPGPPDPPGPPSPPGSSGGHTEAAPSSTGTGTGTCTAAVATDGIDPAEAAALAGAFAADLLSWDEDDPARRGRALGAHLASQAGTGLLGWTGTGRQRADLVLPGRVRTDADRVHVDVRVRVVPYRRVEARAPGAPEPEPETPLGGPAAAPAASARGWRGLAARWVRIEVTVARVDARLVVDAGPAGGASGPPSPADLAARGRSR